MNEPSIRSGWNEVNVALDRSERAREYRLEGLVRGPHSGLSDHDEWCAWAVGPGEQIVGRGQTAQAALRQLARGIRSQLPAAPQGYPEHDTPAYRGAKAAFEAARERREQAQAVYDTVTDQADVEAKKSLLPGRHKADPAAWVVDLKRPENAHLAPLVEDASSELAIALREEREARAAMQVAGRQVIVIGGDGDREARQRRLADATASRGPRGILARIRSLGATP